MPYGTSGVEALTLLPKTIKLNVKGGTTVDAATTWTWDESVSFDPTNTTAKHTANGTFTVPPGYTYSGSTAVTVTVSVKELDKTGLEAALTAAKTQQSQFEKVTDATQATKTDKIYIVPDETDASAITKGVKFVLQKDAIAYETLKATISNAKQGVDAGGAKKFDSQKECDEMTAKLKADMDAVDKMTKQTGTNTTTDAFIMNEAKKILDGWKTQPDYAYNPEIWPLKQWSQLAMRSGCHILPPG